MLNEAHLALWTPQVAKFLPITNIRKARNFTIFPRLPLELNIWSLASETQQAEARVLDIAPDFRDLRSFIHRRAEAARFSIIDHKLWRGESLVPSLFHVCRYSRSLVKRSYTLWPCASPETFSPDVTHININIDHDLFYFRFLQVHEFQVLQALKENKKNDMFNDAVHDIARDKFLEIFSGYWKSPARNFAFVWKLWVETLAWSFSASDSFKWYQNLWGLSTTLTITIRHPLE